MSGWIKLHRKVLKWEWYNDPSTFRVFTHLLLTANHKPDKWQGIVIGRGQVVTGLYALSEKTGLSPRNIRTAMTKLKSTNELTIRTTNRFSIITIVKYDDYQDGDKPTDNQATNDRQTNDKRTTTSKEDKEDKKVKKEKKDIAKPDFVDSSVWQDFLALRKAKRAPISETALRGITAEATNAGLSLQQALEYMIKRNWQGFEASWLTTGRKNGTNGKQPTGHAAHSALYEAASRKVEQDRLSGKAAPNPPELEFFREGSPSYLGQGTKS